MAKFQTENNGYSSLKKAISNNVLDKLYLFFGEERYLLEYYLGEIRKLLLSNGMEEFNNKRFQGKNISLSELSDAIDALPVFSERTLIEVYDYDFSKAGEDAREKLLEMFSDLPDYVCIIFIFDTVEFKLDKRIKQNAQLDKLFSTVEFRVQEQSDLIGWVSRRFKALGKRIDKTNAEYLAYISGGLMTNLIQEIEKISAYNEDEIISKNSIDAVVTPVLDAAIYQMTDALIKCDYDASAKILSDLLRMQEVPHRIIYSISLKMRQLLAARVCIDSGKGAAELMDMCGIRMDFLARNLFAAARKTDETWCTAAVKACSETALRMNSSGSDNDKLLSQLLIDLAAFKSAEATAGTNILRSN